MLAVGKYFGGIVSAVTSESEKGNPQAEIRVMLEFVLGQSGDWEPAGRVERTCYLSLTDDAYPYSADKLKSIGFNGDYGNIKFDPMVMAGGNRQDGSSTGTEWEIKHEEYRGKTREKLELPFGRRDSKPAKESILKQLNAKWNSQNRAQPVPAGRPETAPAVKRPPVPEAAAATTENTPAAVVEINNKTVAWAKYCDSRNGAPDLKRWTECVNTIAAESKCAESHFSPTHWASVLDLASVAYAGK